MQPEGLVSEAFWNSFDPTMPMEEPEPMSQPFAVHPPEHDQDVRIAMQSMFWTGHCTHSYYCLDSDEHNEFYWPQGNCSASTADAGTFFDTTTSCEGNCTNDLNTVHAISSLPTDFCTVQEQATIPIGHCDQFNKVLSTNETSSDEAGDLIEKPPMPHLPPELTSRSIKRRLLISDVEKPLVTKRDGSQMGGPRKKARASILKKENNPQSKKTRRKSNVANEEEIVDEQSCSFENDSNASQELDGAFGTSSTSKASATLNQNAKKRASRGSATTDAQSLYARKRRERINERLRILQNLVPNGTKVDISTMLEEAAHYVKFMHLQIKLLSSDELWMYAPIAYNGTNIGLDLKVPPPS